ncbi:MarC family protein [Eikenella sp. Marseille-P7795]|uniref:MarC family protein n=1 Tax=Eikenella sp. Marseille-P7795 TaxID=2866577 RepID=UPI001CE43F2E|nr:MarC family protein [Eikenella sp. Marseille-P7795]
MITYTLYLFTGLIVLNNPLIALGYFVEKTENFTPKEQRKTARLVAMSAFVCMVVAGVIGTPLLKVLGISIPAFQISGGILVFVIALSMMGGEDNPVKPSFNNEHEHSSLPPEKQFAFAVVPMATPIIVGPGGFSIVIIHSSHVKTWIDAVQLLAACFMVGVACYLLLAGAARLSKLLGSVGIKIINRVSGLLLAAIAVEIVLSGLRGLFPGLKIMG